MLFGDRLAQAVERVGAPLCVGLDPHLDRLPPPLRERYAGRTGRSFRQEAARAVEEFDAIVIDAVAPWCAVLKPQLAFYEALGAPGMAALEASCDRARRAGMLVIADAKRGDIASTAEAYARALLHPDGPVAADAVTLSPWMGLDGVEPFLALCRAHGRGLFLLTRTSNPGSGFLQLHGEPPAAHLLARAIDELGAELRGDSGWSSVGAVVGAPAAAEAANLRALMPWAWFLVPGVGAQGGRTEEALAGVGARGLGCLVVSARGVLYPSGNGEDADPARAIRSRAHDLFLTMRL